MRQFNHSVAPYKQAYILVEPTLGHLKIERIRVDRIGGTGTKLFNLKTDLANPRGWLFEEQEKFSGDVPYVTPTRTSSPLSFHFLMTFNSTCFVLVISNEILEDLKRLNINFGVYEEHLLQEVANVYKKIEYVQGGHIDKDGNFHKDL